MQILPSIISLFEIFRATEAQDVPSEFFSKLAFEAKREFFGNRLELYDSEFYRESSFLLEKLMVYKENQLGSFAPESNSGSSASTGKSLASSNLTIVLPAVSVAELDLLKHLKCPFETISTVFDFACDPESRAEFSTVDPAILFRVYTALAYEREKYFDKVRYLVLYCDLELRKLRNRALGRDLQLLNPFIRKVAPATSGEEFPTGACSSLLFRLLVRVYNTAYCHMNAFINIPARAKESSFDLLEYLLEEVHQMHEFMQIYLEEEEQVQKDWETVDSGSLPYKEREHLADVIQVHSILLLHLKHSMALICGIFELYFKIKKFSRHTTQRSDCKGRESPIYQSENVAIDVLLMDFLRTFFILKSSVTIQPLCE